MISRTIFTRRISGHLRDGPKSVLPSTWRRMVNKAEVVTDDLGKLQTGFKKFLSGT